jgi:hypothetical protein
MKIIGVSYENITKVVGKAKADIAKISGERPTTPPSCEELELKYGEDGRSACQARESATYYYDSTSGVLYSDECGGTEADQGYYSDGRSYGRYIGEGLEFTDACGR